MAVATHIGMFWRPVTGVATLARRVQVNQVTVNHLGCRHEQVGVHDRTQAVVAVYESGLFVPRSARPSR